MSRPRRTMLMTLLILLTAAGCLSWPAQRAGVLSFMGSRRENSTAFEASGTIEAEQVTIASEIGGRVVMVYGRQGQTVEQGEVLIALDDALIRAQIGQAQAEVEKAQAELEQLLAGARPHQVERARAELAQAEAKAAGAKQAWEDARRLREDPQELDAQIHAAQNEVALAEARLDAARARLSEAEARYEASKGGGSDIEKTTQEILRRQVEAARLAVQQAELALAGARQTLAVLQQIRAQPASLDTSVHQAEWGYKLAEAEVEVRRAELALLTAGPRAEEVALARRKVELAQRAVEALEVQRDKLTLRAPIAGLISSVMIHDGESATAGAALMTISDLAHVHLTIYVPEADLGRVYLGQPAEVRVDAYPDRVFPGRVTYIASQAEFTPRSVQTKEERVNMVFAVKIALDNAEGILKPGMPADAKLLP